MKNNYLYCLVLLFGLSFSAVSAQSLDFYLTGHQMPGDQTTSEELVLEIEDVVVGGFGTGISAGKYNVNLGFMFGSTNAVSEDNVLETKLFNFDLNLDYRLLDFCVSPLLSAGFGSMTFSDSHYKIESFNETDFSYNYGAGLQATISKQFVIKALYRTTVTKLKETDDSLQFKGFFFALGYMLKIN